MKKFLESVAKGARIALIALMILGILSSAFGVTVAALSDQNKQESEEEFASIEGAAKPQKPEDFVAPTQQYADMGDPTATVKSTVTPISQEDAQVIYQAATEVAHIDNYNGKYMRIRVATDNLLPKQEQTGDQPQELTPEQKEAQKKLKEETREKLRKTLDTVNDHGMIFLPGDATGDLGGDRIFQVRKVYFSGDEGYLELQEPYFEDVFESLQINTTEMLTEDNLVRAYYAEGVSSHFGNVDQEIFATSAAGQEAATSSLTTSDMTAAVMPLDNKVSTGKGDLIVTLDYELDSEKSGDIESTLTLSGSFGIRDLQAHLVCDMPRPADFEELYFGLSGETFVNLTLKGSVEGTAEPEATDLDLGILTLEGLNEKRFPIAVFQFVGTTPVKISNKVFEASRESLLPNLYVILYADWEGSITMEMSSTLEYSHSFNSGLRVYKEGELTLQFEDYPYTDAYDAQEESGGLKWDTALTLEAKTDITLFGGSVLFYVAGVNIGEISAARVGLEAKCDLSLTATLGEELKPSADMSANAYLRGYLKILEVKMKLKAEGKAFLEGFSEDVEFFLCVLDITLFRLGETPDEFKPKMPVSSMPRPHEFESVVLLVTDVSGSMDDRVASGQTKLQAAKDASEMIVTTTEQWNNNYEGNYGMGVVQFSDKAQVVAMPHIDYRFIRECIEIMGDGGGTDIYTGIDAGVAQLEMVKSDNKVMILMTDGQDSNDSKTKASAQKAADAGITIYTVGFGNDVDENLLQQVADLTGGEYRYANTENIMGIIGSFIHAQQASNAEVLTEMESTVGEGETSEESQFVVKDENGDLVVTTAWPGSFLDTILVDPNGREVDEEYPGAITDESKIPSTITVKNPIPGKWSVKVKGVETSYEQEPFYTIVAFKETDASQVNREMTNLEQIAAWCLPIGLTVTVFSVLMLMCLGKKKKTEE